MRGCESFDKTDGQVCVRTVCCESVGKVVVDWQPADEAHTPETIQFTGSMQIACRQFRPEPIVIINISFKLQRSIANHPKTTRTHHLGVFRGESNVLQNRKNTTSRFVSGIIRIRQTGQSLGRSVEEYNNHVGVHNETSPNIAAHDTLYCYVRNEQLAHTHHKKKPVRPRSLTTNTNSTARSASVVSTSSSLLPPNYYIVSYISSAMQRWLCCGFVLATITQVRRDHATTTTTSTCCTARTMRFRSAISCI